MRPAHILALLLSVCLLLSGCSTLPSTSLAPAPNSATSGTDSRPTEVTPSAVTPTLPWNAADTLHPYESTSQRNRQLLSLAYEGLTAVDASWEAVPALAASWEATAPTQITVTLREQAVFSDGSPVTATEVADSLWLAKRSPYYRELTQNLVSVRRGADDRTLVITLTAADVHYAATLSFPIVKEAGDRCLGTGRYVFDAASRTMVAATTHPAPAVPVWSLYDVRREAVLAYALESQAIAYYFTTLSDGQPPRGVGSVTQTGVVQNDLLFVGFHAGSRPFSDPEARLAINGMIRRATLCAEALQGYAVPATTPFIPTWSGAKGLQGLPESENIASAIAKWKDLGYNSREVTLLVCADSAVQTATAAVLGPMLTAGGVRLQVVSLPREEYLSHLQHGEFDLYLGELSLGADMGIASLCSGALADGTAAEAATLYARYRRGELTAEAFCQAFAASAPFLPLCFRQGVAVGRPALTGCTPTGADPYFGIAAWSLS